MAPPPLQGGVTLVIAVVAAAIVAAHQTSGWRPLGGGGLGLGAGSAGISRARTVLVKLVEL